MNKPYRLADSVLHRVIQMLQEAMLIGVDIADLMRQMELKPDENDPHVLVLSEEYLEQIKRWHKQLLADAERLSSQATNENSDSGKKLIMS